MLRSMSIGRMIKDTAEYLNLGEETVRSQLKKRKRGTERMLSHRRYASV